MPIIDRTALLGSWRSYKYQYNDRETMQDADNWIEWTFHTGGNAWYLLTRNKTLINDQADRVWTIKEKETDGNLSSHIFINNAHEYEVLSIDKNNLVLKSISGITYHLASKEKWNELMGM